MTESEMNELHDYSQMNPDIPPFMRDILFRAFSELQTLVRLRAANTDLANTFRQRAKDRRVRNDLGGSTAYETAAQIVETWTVHAELPPVGGPAQARPS